MHLRYDKPYIGAENIEVKVTGKKLYIEAGLFLLLGIVFLLYFLTHTDLIRGYFRAGKSGPVLGIFIILLLSPLGAHLIAGMLSFIWEKLKLK